MGDTEHEPAIFYKQASLPMEGLVPQPSHITIDLQVSLPTKCAGAMVTHKLWE